MYDPHVRKHIFISGTFDLWIPDNIFNNGFKWMNPKIKLDYNFAYTDKFTFLFIIEILFKNKINV